MLTSKERKIQQRKPSLRLQTRSANRSLEGGWSAAYSVHATKFMTLKLLHRENLPGSQIINNQLRGSAPVCLERARKTNALWNVMSKRPNLTSSEGEISPTNPGNPSIIAALSGLGF